VAENENPRFIHDFCISNQTEKEEESRRQGREKKEREGRRRGEVV
jgi:hypothetical protein